MRWSAIACLAASAVCSAQERPARFAITSSQIAAAMLSRQLPTEDAAIVIAAPVTSRSENPPLEVQSMQLVSSHVLRLRIACRNHAECLSFFALATYPEAIDPASVQEIPKAATAAPSRAAGQPADPGALPAPAASASDTALKGQQRALTMHSGSPVLLQMNGDRIHILVQVICLEGGSTGDTIRVATRDRKQSYVARIVNPTLVEGTL